MKRTKDGLRPPTGGPRAEVYQSETRIEAKEQTIMRHSPWFLALAASLALAGPTKADVVLSFPASHTGLLGTEQDFSLGSSTVKAYGFNSVLNGAILTLHSATALYGKTGSPDETGLGIANDPTGDHEITPYSTIKLDLTSYFSSHPVVPVTITIGSVQSGEGFAIFGGSGGPTTELYQKNGSGPQATYSFTATASQVVSSGETFYVTATWNNVLLEGVNVAVPEPGSFTLALTGLTAMAGIAWRRRRNRS
jgi:hypothetical protein